MMAGERRTVDGARKTGRLFALLLLLYPRSFRDAFGVEMHEVFEAQLAAARARGGRTAAWTLLARTVPRMAAAAWRESRDSRATRRGPLVQWTDLRYTIRRLAAAPGFTVAVAGTLGLCIGANLTVFTAVHAVLLRPLPFSNPDRLVTIYNTYPGANVPDDGATVANYYERRGHIHGLSSVSLYRDDAAIVGETGNTEREFVMRVSSDFFTTLGVRPLLGRPFRDEETVFGSDRVAILSEPYWRQQYGGGAAAVGRSIRVNGTAFTVVGVLPADFRFLSSSARIFLPLSSGDNDRLSSHRHWGSSSQMVARLAPGVSLSEAQSQIDARDAIMERDDPEAAMMKDVGYRSVVVPLHARHVEAIRPALLLLQAGAGTLLLIGLVNVANLFLVRAEGRARELAVRRAVGARRAHIVGAVLAETLLLSTAGAALGLLVASGGVALLGRLGASRLPLGSQIALDGMAMLAAAAAAVAIGLVLGLAVALPHVRSDAGETLHAGPRGATAGLRARRARHVILVTQIALSLLLLSSASILASGVRSLLRISPGFQPDQLLTAQVSLPYSRYRTDASLQSFVDRLRVELGRVPGLADAGVATNIPLSGNAMRSAATIAGRPPRPGELPQSVYSYAVAGDYFAALRIPVLDGRVIGPSDNTASRICVVDEDFARRYWPAGGALGHRLFLGGSEGAPADAYAIVGVVGVVKQASLSEAPGGGAVYYPYSGRFDRSIYVVGRTSVPPDTLIPDLRRAIRQIDPELPVNNARPMRARIDDSLDAQRSPAMIGELFSAIALVLTVLGTYGVLSYAVTQRRREVGLRLALGASQRQVRGQFLRMGLGLLAKGLALGLVGSWSAVRAIHAALPDVPHAPAGAVAAAAGILTVVCLAACLVPARRASRIAPMEALARDV
jgi:predicted permease